MTAIPFDTLKFVERLRDVGIPEVQAKAIAEAIREAQGKAERGALMANRVKKPRLNPGRPPISEDIERFIGKMKGEIPSASITAAYALYEAREVTNHMLNYFSHAEDRKTKEYAQQLARYKWASQSDEKISDIADTVHEILRLEGKQYAKSTVRVWVSEVAPPQAHKPGRRPTK